jgi:hypothetical protein
VPVKEVALAVKAELLSVPIASVAGSVARRGLPSGGRHQSAACAAGGAGLHGGSVRHALRHPELAEPSANGVPGTQAKDPRRREPLPRCPALRGYPAGGR